MSMDNRAPIVSVPTVTTQSGVVTFEAIAIVSGKGTTALQKVEQHKKNGADIRALMAAGINKSAIVKAQALAGFRDTAHALSAGNIRPAYAVVVAKLGKAQNLLTEDGKAPYSEWLRLGAVIRGMAQQTSAGKPTTAAKALALWEEYHNAAAEMRAARAAQREALTQNT